MNDVTSALAQGKTLLINENPRDIAWLLAHVLNWSPSQLLTHAAYRLTNEQWLSYQSLLLRRHQGEPLAYLLGHWEFWSLPLMVGPAVLIPRPETELLVEVALQYLNPQTALAVADLGTGSGAIALAVAHERPDCHITATDCCPQALAIAATNARQLGLTNVEFMLGNWCAPLGAKRFHLILSNPPYVAANDPCLAQLRFEPQIALSVDGDGLAAIRMLVATAPAYLYPGGMLLLEHGYHQGPAVRQLFTALNYQKITTILDLERRERVTIGVGAGM